MSANSAAGSTSAASEPLKLLLARAEAVELSHKDIELVSRSLLAAGEEHALALAVLARTLTSNRSPASSSPVKVQLARLLSGTDSADLVEGFRLCTCIFQVAPDAAAALVKDPEVSSPLQEAIETTSAASSSGSTKGKEKQGQATLELVELLSVAAANPSVRPIVDQAASSWLEDLLGLDEDRLVQPDARRLAATAGCATVKLRLGREAAAATGIPAQKQPSRWSSESIAKRLVDLVRISTASEKVDPVLPPVLEGLAFLTLTPSPKIKAIASEDGFLRHLFAFEIPSSSSTASPRPAAGAALDYAIATLLDQLTRYPEAKSSMAEARQVEQLKRFAAAAGREDEEFAYESSLAVEERVVRIARLQPVPTLRRLCTSPSIQTRRAAASVLHSLVTPQKLRGEMLQAGVARLFLSLIRHLPTPYMASEDIDAVQGLAKLLITANPLLVLGPKPDSPLLLEAAYDLTLPLASPGDGSAGAGLLARFECLMALTNVASVDPNMADSLARMKLRDRPETLVLGAIEEQLLSSNSMVCRAATELICNLAASDAGIEYFEPSASNTGPASAETPSQRLHVLVALTSSPDTPTRAAAAGAFTSLVYSPQTAVALCQTESWRVALVSLLQDTDPGVRHRAYEVWRVIGSVVGQLPASERTQAAAAIGTEPTVRSRLEEALRTEKVDQLKEVAKAA